MYNKSTAAQNYLEKQIMTATPAERIVLLYDGGIRFLMLAKKNIEEGDIQSRFNNNKRAGDIITYLMATLDKERGGEIAENLERLYVYMLHRLMDVDLKNDASAIDDVVGKLRTLRVSWEKISKGEIGPDGVLAEERKESPKDEKSLQKCNALA
jgi:flagellar protein FliS